MTTTTTAPRAATAPRLRLPQFLGYASGDAACNLAFSMASMFLLLYYTDVVGISAAAAGTLFLVVRAWDAFADIFAGRVVDKTMTRFGKFRPFFLYGSIPVLLLSVATFSVPGGLGDGGKLAYAYVTYALLGLAYSLVNIPYGSLASAMTQDSGERAKLASFRVIGSNITILMLAFVVAPQIRGSENLQHSLTITTLIFVPIGFALFLFLFKTARENVVREVPSVSVKQTVQTLRQNRPLALLCLSSLAFLTAMFSLSTIGVYYARDVLGDANLYIWLTVAQTVGTFVVASQVPRLVRTLGKKKSYIALGILFILAGIGLTFAPASVPMVAIGLFFVAGIALGGVNTLMWALEADTVEYGEWKTGVRTEGITYALFSFTRKLGQAVGGAVAAYTIGFAGYVGDAQVQTDTALWGIRAAAGLMPAVFIVVALLLMAIYPLTERAFSELMVSMAERRAARAAGKEL
jgi:glucuronide carrier protein